MVVEVTVEVVVAKMTVVRAFPSCSRLNLCWAPVNKLMKINLYLHWRCYSLPVLIAVAPSFLTIHSTIPTHLQWKFRRVNYSPIVPRNIDDIPVQGIVITRQYCAVSCQSHLVHLFHRHKKKWDVSFQPLCRQSTTCFVSILLTRLAWYRTVYIQALVIEQRDAEHKAYALLLMQALTGQRTGVRMVLKAHQREVGARQT